VGLTSPAEVHRLCECRTDRTSQLRKTSCGHEPAQNGACSSSNGLQIVTERRHGQDHVDLTDVLADGGTAT
jgi:hypothetical protein